MGRMARPVRPLMLTAGLALAMFAGAAEAQFLSKPVRLLVPLAAGGPTDILARSLADGMSPLLGGQRIVVENRVGASGQIAVDALARSEADGNTMLMATLGTVILPSTNKGFAAETLKKLAPVTLVDARPVVIVVPAELPAKTMTEFVAYAKANPGKLNYGAQGASDILGIGLLGALAGIDVVTVRYPGGAPALQAVVTNQVQFTIASIGAAKPFADNGQVRMIASTGPTRWEKAPELQAVAEVVPGFDFVSWTGLVVPAGTPADAIQKLNAAARQAMTERALIDRFEQLGTKPEPTTPEAFGKFFEAEVERWAKAAKTINFQAE